MGKKSLILIIVLAIIAIVIVSSLWQYTAKKDMTDKIPEEQKEAADQEAAQAECATDEECDDNDNYTTDICSGKNECLYYMKLDIAPDKTIGCTQDSECDDSNIYTWDFCSGSVCNHYYLLTGKITHTMTQPVLMPGAPLPITVPVPMPTPVMLQPGPGGVPIPVPTPTPVPPAPSPTPSPSPAPSPAPSPTPTPTPTPTPVPNATIPIPPSPYPLHCSNLLADVDESDWNCGGGCAPCPPVPPYCDDINFPSPWNVPCSQHLSCWANSDCATGNCDMSSAQPLPAMDPNTGTVYTTLSQLRLLVGQSWIIPYSGLCK